MANRRDCELWTPEAPKSFDEKFSSGASIETGVSGRARMHSDELFRRRKPSETSPYDISEIESK